MRRKDYYRSIINVKAFCPNDAEIIKILEYCKLKPSVSWKVWIDDSGNSCMIVAPDDIRTSTEPKQPQYSDLYLKAHPSRIFRKSQFALIGSCEAKYEMFYCWLIGKDNRIRVLINSKQEWRVGVAPLVTGIDALREVIRYSEVEQPMVVRSFTVKTPTARNIIQAVATPWPPTPDTKFEEPINTLLKEVLSITTSTRLVACK